MGNNSSSSDDDNENVDTDSHFHSRTHGINFGTHNPPSINVPQQSPHSEPTGRNRSNSIEVQSPTPRVVVPSIPPKIIHKILTILYREAVPESCVPFSSTNPLGSRKSWNTFLNFSSTCKTIYSMSWNPDFGFRRSIKFHASHIILPNKTPLIDSESHSIHTNMSPSLDERPTPLHSKQKSKNRKDVRFKIENTLYPKGVTTISLRSRKQISPELVDHLLNVFDLSKLDLSAQPIPQPQDWARLLNSWKLTYLNIFHTSLWTNQLVSILANSKSAKSLKELSLAQTLLDDRAFSFILSKTPSLQRLNLWRTRASDQTLSTIAKHCLDIRLLNLRKTLITDIGISSLSARTSCKLTELLLDGTRITGRGLKKLSHGLPYLSLLSLNNIPNLDPRIVDSFSLNHPSATIKISTCPAIISKSIIPLSKSPFSSIELGEESLGNSLRQNLYSVKDQNQTIEKLKNNSKRGHPGGSSGTI